jgi:hypothetical protein
MAMAKSIDAIFEGGSLLMSVIQNLNREFIDCVILNRVLGVLS